jgi:hypothetical protein
VSIDAKEAIGRLCALVGEVYAARTTDAAASDCFCGTHGLWGVEGYDGTHAGGYRNDGEAVAFVERVVREALEKEKQERQADPGRLTRFPMMLARLNHGAHGKHQASIVKRLLRWLLDR